MVPVPPGNPWPSGLPEGTDFWLFDFSVLYELRYDPDGSWVAAEQMTEPAAIEQACRWREIAIQPVRRASDRRDADHFDR
ncbi:MAG: DUF6879 family protein [Pseudonocardiaceae bacterium]